MFYTILVVVYVLVCVGLIVVVLLQSGKGEGLAGVLGGGASQTIFGSRTGDVLTKGTTVLAILFMSISLLLAILSGRRGKPLSQEIARAAAQAQPPAAAAEDQPAPAENKAPGTEIPPE